jgi:hypothetical protein
LRRAAKQAALGDLVLEGGKVANQISLFECKRFGQVGRVILWYIANPLLRYADENIEIDVNIDAALYKVYRNRKRYIQRE